MEENLKWLWYAFSAAWIIHILYVASIASRAKDLRGQIDNLKTLLQDQQNRSEEPTQEGAPHSNRPAG
ncbi:MAG: hypothetical protein F4X39_07365 [Acidobacteriia bacterium]|nr:hypothetical protein [Terriglobia bacterium]